MFRYIFFIILFLSGCNEVHQERIAVLGYYALEPLIHRCKAVCLDGPAQIILTKKYSTNSNGNGSECEVVADCLCDQGNSTFYKATINYSMFSKNDPDVGSFGASNLCDKSMDEK